MSFWLLALKLRKVLVDMKKITVNASKTYDVIIEKGSLDRIGEYAAAAGRAGKACIISDSNVAPLYLERTKKSLEKAGLLVCSYVFAAGEASKNATTFIDILNFLAENHFTRKDTVFALGGGVTGDISGFAAATYMRGISFVQLPTSLLACVDSSVGGKTAIDLPAGKNLAGAFHQPEFVLIDTELLDTLPDKYYCDGMAEVIKYAMIKDGQIQELLMNDNNIEEIIYRCVKIKRDVVCEDEFETGIRRILNFGHTAGHAIEHAADFSISHGNAVATGMYIVTRAFEKEGLCKNGTCDALVKMLDKFSLPKKCCFSPELLAEIALGDKKAEGGGINLVAVRSIGESFVQKVSMEELLNIFRKGVE